MRDRLSSDEDNDTPLHWAVKYNFYDDVWALLSRGVDPNTKNKVGETPLMLAVKYGHSTLLPLLFQYNVKMSKEDILVMTSYLKLSPDEL